MKKLIVLCGKECGYCKKAKMLIKRALSKQPKYIAVDIRFVLEETAEGKKYAHTLVPTFYCNDELLFEGNPSMDIVCDALKKCY